MNKLTKISKTRVSFLKPLLVFVAILCFFISPSHSQTAEEILSTEWVEHLSQTDFTKTDISLDLLVAANLLEETIKGLSAPQFMSTIDSESIFGDKEPVIVVKIGNDIRAYPLRYLLWYRAINDVIGGQPILVTFNPYTDAFQVFSRIIAGNTYQFTDSGLLYKASILLQDTLTGSLFLQANGKGAVGDLYQQKLTSIASEYVGFDSFKRRYGQNGQVMSSPDILDNDWVLLGKTPLPGYESSIISPYYIGKNIPVSNTIRHFDRIITYGGRKAGWSINYIRNRGEVRINSDRVRLRWESGLNAVQDTFDIRNGRNIGMVHVEKQSANGNWQPILFYREFLFSYMSFFPGRRVFHDTRLRN